MKYIALLVFFPILLSAQNQSQESLAEPKEKVFLPRSAEEAQKSQPQSPSFSVMNSFLQALLVVFLFLLLVYVCFQWIRKKKLLAFGGEGDQGMKVLGSVGVGSNKSVCVLYVASRVYVLGVADQQVSLLDTIEDPQEIQTLLQLSTYSQKEGKREFFDIFKQFFNTNGNARSLKL